jgi:pimeloyl-ACP methyl ester carboxylesterase
MRHTLPLARTLLVALFAALIGYGGALHAQPYPAGKSLRIASINGEDIEIHAYKPAQYAGGPVLLVLHGLGANATGYRDYAIPLADKLGYLVIAPLFDRKRFPVWRYQTGGIVRDQRAAELKVEPQAQWTGQLFLAIVNSVRKSEENPDLGYSLIGHSAGGQTLSRFAAFIPHQAGRIVIANPSTHLLPSLTERFPYGFGGLPPAMANEAALKRYLAQPVTLLLGTADNKRDRDLNVSEGADRQGANRLERGHNTFRIAQELAKQHGWPFAWQLIEVPDVGHSARLMLGSPQAAEAVTTDKQLP